LVVHLQSFLPGLAAGLGDGVWLVGVGNLQCVDAIFTSRQQQGRVAGVGYGDCRCGPYPLAIPFQVGTADGVGLTDLPRVGLGAIALYLGARLGCSLSSCVRDVRFFPAIQPTRTASPRYFPTYKIVIGLHLSLT
jgi:hypothetical protein